MKKRCYSIFDAEEYEEFTTIAYRPKSFINI